MPTISAQPDDFYALLGVKPTTLNEMIKRYGIREVVRENA